jgi:hypothetical protein
MMLNRAVLLERIAELKNKPSTSFHVDEVLPEFKERSTWLDGVQKLFELIKTDEAMSRTGFHISIAIYLEDSPNKNETGPNLMEDLQRQLHSTPPELFIHKEFKEFFNGHEKSGKNLFERLQVKEFYYQWWVPEESKNRRTYRLMIS